MNMNFDKELGLYQMTQAIKKVKPAGHALFDFGVLFNQQVLTSCGKIHAKLMQLSDKKAEQFETDNSDFFESFTWTYYMDWRKTRAKSCTHQLHLFDVLNVKLGVQHFVGETFYAGIPVVTAAEIDNAIQTCQVDDDNVPIQSEDDGFSHEKVGVDGQLHKTDCYGEFEPWSDPNDIYGDDTGVTVEDLKTHKSPDEVKLPEAACLACKAAGGNGSACTDCDGWKTGEF